MNNYAVVFLLWGEEYVKQALHCIRNSPPLKQYDKVLITDQETPLSKEAESLFTTIIRADFQLKKNKRKAEILHFLPKTYNAYLYLDSDTVVLDDITLGFEMAERYSLALSPEAHYSLDSFWNFDEVMELENVPPKGQLQFNAGIYFFSITPELEELFERWFELAEKYTFHYKGDQPYLSLAMIQMNFNPYVLSLSYNYRGYGIPISGKVRIWHSKSALPKNLNEFDKPWPPRRVTGGQVVYPLNDKSLIIKVLIQLQLRFRQWLGIRSR